jgi:hypothetical protein
MLNPCAGGEDVVDVCDLALVDAKRAHGFLGQELLEQPKLSQECFPNSAIAGIGLRARRLSPVVQQPIWLNLDQLVL